MNKKIKGYELMKLIAEKQIKNKQEFLFTNADGVEEKIFWNGENFNYSEAGNSFALRTVSDIEFVLGDFEILEDEEEIDIQEIELAGLKSFVDADGKIDNVNLAYKYNELVLAVKQLDKKINKED